MSSRDTRPQELYANGCSSRRCLSSRGAGAWLLRGMWAFSDQGWNLCPPQWQPSQSPLAPCPIHGEQQQLWQRSREGQRRSVKEAGQALGKWRAADIFPSVAGPLPSTSLASRYGQSPLTAWHSSLATFFWNMTAQSWAPSNVTRKTPGFLELSPGSLLSITLSKGLRSVHFCGLIYFRLPPCTLLSWALLYTAGTRSLQLC